MTSFKKACCLTPLALILCQLIIFTHVDFSPRFNPESDRNTPINNLRQYLETANLNPINFSILGYQNEVSFFLENPDHSTYPVFLSTIKNPVAQVAVLQKLAKIVNIKGNDIKFIDLSSSRPYATF